MRLPVQSEVTGKPALDTVALEGDGGIVLWVKEAAAEYVGLHCRIWERERGGLDLHVDRARFGVGGIECKGAGEAVEPAVDRQHSKRERGEIDPGIGRGDDDVAHCRA